MSVDKVLDGKKLKFEEALPEIERLVFQATNKKIEPDSDFQECIIAIAETLLVMEHTIHSLSKKD